MERCASRIVRAGASFCRMAAQVRIAQVGHVHLVELDIAAAGGGEVGDLLGVDAGEVGVEVLDVGIGLGVDGVSAAAEVDHARRWDGDLGRLAGHRLQEGEVVDEDRLGARDLAHDPHGGRAARLGPLLVVERRRELRLVHLHIGDLQQEIDLPGLAVVFAVGDRLQAEILLQLDHVADGVVLDGGQGGLVDLAGRLSDAGVKKRLRAKQAADVVGAKRRFLAFRHLYPSWPGLLPMPSGA